MHRGGWLLVAAGLTIFGSTLLRDRPERPVTVFYAPLAADVRIVELGRGFCPEGTYQFFDGRPPRAANVLTVCDPEDQGALAELSSWPPISGERLEIIEKSPSGAVLARSWMTAARRLAVGVALHPDRMSPADWSDLPGIGPVTAETIELDRQRNGDFRRLEALERVPGIGPVRIQRLKPYFE